MSTPFAIGITIHNEEKNIGRLLDALRAESLGGAGLCKVIVVSSGSTDGSDAIVAERARTWPLLELEVEAERRGKASAINRFLLASRKAELAVLLSGDVIPAPGAIRKLLHAFTDPTVGMAGGRPTPSGTPTRLVHRIAHLQWDLHHEVALHHPKLGEAVAFRNVLEAIPADTAVDEAAIEAALKARGYRFAYVPEAVIHNKGPDTIRDFLKQRRRIAIGHRHLARTQGYTVSTNHHLAIIRPVAGYLVRHPGAIPIAVITALLEAYGRLLGFWDLTVRGRNPYIWEVATSTKDLGAHTHTLSEDKP